MSCYISLYNIIFICTEISASKKFKSNVFKSKIYSSNSYKWIAISYKSKSSIPYSQIYGMH